MLDLKDVKTWLRLEESDTSEDALLQSLIVAAEDWLRGALECWIDPAKNPQAKVVVLAMIADMYENREAVSAGAAAQAAGMRATIQSLLTQLRYSYPVITTQAMPPAVVGEQYEVTLAAEGGTPPYTWTVSDGGFPVGLGLDERTGLVTGIPSETGTFVAHIELTDSSTVPKIVSRPVVIEVNEP